MRCTLFVATFALGCAAASSSAGPPTPFRGATSCAGLPSADSAVYDTSQVTEHPRVRRGGPMPAYPIVELQRRIQGRVIIGVIVESDGTVDQDSVRVLQSVDQAIDREALRWVRGASFWPACRDGRPVRVRVAVPIDFRTKEGI